METELSLVKTNIKSVSHTPIVAGQYIYCTDSVRAFYDVSDNSRIEVLFSIEDKVVPDYIIDRVINKVYYLEPVHRFYVYETTGFRRIITNKEADAIYGSYGLIPFTMEEQLTGIKLAPRTLASCVYTAKGESVESLIANTYRLGNMIMLSKITANNIPSIPIPFPFTDYFIGGNLMEVYYNGIRINKDSDYLVSDEDSLVFLSPINVRANDVVTFDFKFNSTNTSSSERYQTVIEGGYLTNKSVSIDKLEKITDSYLLNDNTIVATAAAVNAAYNKVNDRISEIITEYKGSYKTESAGTSDILQLSIPNINLQDGTEINVKLSKDLNNEAVCRLNTNSDVPIYINGTRATGLYKKGDYICLVYSAIQNCYNIKLYCDYKITTYFYSIAVNENENIIPFYIPQ